VSSLAAETALPARLDARGMSQRAMLALSAGLMAINSSHHPITAAISLPLLGLALAGRARSAWPWWLAALAWAPFASFGWDRFEDHVYLGWMWLLAVGIALSGPDDEFWERLALSARWLLGVTFAVAAAWKWATPEFWSGATFEFLVLDDSRLHVPFLAPLSGLGLARVEANAALLEGLRAWNGGEGAVALARGPRLGWVLGALVAWTLAIETAIAAAFLAPDRSRLARLRHPALLAFLVSVYAFLPVAGFLVALVTLGLAVGRGERRWLALYGLALVALGGTALVRALS